MPTFTVEGDIVRIPTWVVDHSSFRDWLNSDEFPETGRICFLAGEVWVDMSKEQLLSHNQVKFKFTLVVGGIIEAEKRGRYFPDGVLLSNAEVDFTSQPDGMFVSREAMATGQTRFIAGKEAGFVELEGSPDMVLEVVSKSSMHKDTVLLRDLYWQAGIREYWLVDVRGDRLSFEILRHTAKGYTSTRSQNGWIKSNVFGKSFQLTRTIDAEDHPEYTLAVR